MLEAEPEFLSPFGKFRHQLGQFTESQKKQLSEFTEAQKQQLSDKAEKTTESIRLTLNEHEAIKYLHGTFAEIMPDSAHDYIDTARTAIQNGAAQTTETLKDSSAQVQVYATGAASNMTSILKEYGKSASDAAHWQFQTIGDKATRPTNLVKLLLYAFFTRIIPGLFLHFFWREGVDYNMDAVEQ